jgi:hypothetical protein
MQLEFKLDDKSELDLRFEALELKINTYKESSDKVRRGIFARVGEQSKGLMEALDRIQELENEMRRLKRNVNDTQHTEWLYKTGDSLFALAAS